MKHGGGTLALFSKAIAYSRVYYFDCRIKILHDALHRSLQEIYPNPKRNVL